MALQESGQISYGDARSEGGKTSWVNSDYPDVDDVNRLNIDPNWMISVDESNTLGYNPDGSFPITKLYGWDTWNRPTITDCQMNQFWLDPDTTQKSTNVGVRLYFRVTEGDPFRSAYIIYRSTTKSDVQGSIGAGASVVAIIQHGNEGWENMIVGGGQPYILHDPPSWVDYDYWGDHGSDSPSSNSRRLDPSGWSSESAIPDAHFALLDSSATGSENGNGAYYYSVVAVDARVNDTLGFSRGSNTFNVSRPTTVSSYGAQTSPVLFTPSSTGPAGVNDADNGNDGLILFNEFSGLNVLQTFGDGFEIAPINKFAWYRQGRPTSFWVYCTTNTGKAIDGGESTDTTTYTYITPTELDKWVRFLPNSNWAVVSQNLSSNTTYRVFIIPYDQGSSGAPPSADADHVVDVTTAGSGGQYSNPPSGPTQLCQYHRALSTLYEWSGVQNAAEIKINIYDGATLVYDTTLGSASTEWTAEWSNLGLTGSTYTVEVSPTNPEGSSPDTKTLSTYVNQFGNPTTSGATCV